MRRSRRHAWFSDSDCTKAVHYSATHGLLEPHLLLTNCDIPDIAMYNSCLEPRISSAVGDGSCHDSSPVVLTSAHNHARLPLFSSTPLSGDLTRHCGIQPPSSFTQFFPGVSKLRYCCATQENIRKYSAESSFLNCRSNERYDQIATSGVI